MPVERNDTIIVVAQFLNPCEEKPPRKPVLVLAAAGGRRKGVRIDRHLHRRVHDGESRNCFTGRTATIHWEKQGQPHGGVPGARRLQVGLQDRRKPNHRPQAAISSHRPDASGSCPTTTDRSSASDVADQLIYNTVRTDVDEQTAFGFRPPRHPAPQGWRPSDPDDGGEHRGGRFPLTVLAKEKGMSARQLERLFRRYLEPHAEALLHGAPPPEGPQPIDADRHGGHRRGGRLRVRIPLALLQVLPQRLRHDALPGARLALSGRGSSAFAGVIR